VHAPSPIAQTAQPTPLNLRVMVPWSGHVPITPEQYRISVLDAGAN